jgi:hypothetical protein
MGAPQCKMEFDGQLSELDSHYLERRTLQTQTGKIHADICRLGKQQGNEDRIFWLKTELDETTIRIRTLTYLIDKARLTLLTSRRS